jgi:hypothetical protein
MLLEINPWGAYRLEVDGKAGVAPEVLRAAKVTSQGWTVEAAVPAELIDVDWRAPSNVAIRAERIRSRRALSTELRWSWPGQSEFTSFQMPMGANRASLPAPAVRVPVLGNAEPPVEVGRVAQAGFRSSRSRATNLYLAPRGMTRG